MKKYLFIWSITLFFLSFCGKEDAQIPVLLSPINGFMGVIPSEGLNFEWKDVEGAEAYCFQLSNSADFSSLVFVDTILPASIQINSSTFNANTTYYWRVSAINYSKFSSERVFTTVSIVPCLICGMYQGTASGDLTIVGIGQTTTFSAESAQVNVLQNPSETYKMTIDISGLLGSPAGTLVPNFDGVLSGNTLTITNHFYDYSGVAIIIVDGSMNFPSANTSTGTFTFSGDLLGDITFAGTK